MAEAAPIHILSANDFSRTEIEGVCDRTELVGAVMSMHSDRSPFTEYYRGRNFATVFGEPSTRTRISSENAAAAMGMHVSSITAETAAMVKGETLGRTALTLGALGTDLIVMRMPWEGSVAEAAKMSRVSVVNGGDGANEHPTQMLLDIATARRQLGRIDGTNWVAFGDIGHSRTLNSLIAGLGKFQDVHMTLVSSTEELGPSARTLDFLEQNHVPYRLGGNLKDEVKKADVLYGIRTQAERHAGGVVSSSVVLDREVMSHMRQGPPTIIMHPGPHGPEIAPEVYEHPHAVFPEEQVRMGYLSRIALFDYILGGKIYWAMLEEEFGALPQQFTRAA